MRNASQLPILDAQFCRALKYHKPERQTAMKKLFLLTCSAALLPCALSSFAQSPMSDAMILTDKAGNVQTIGISEADEQLGQGWFITVPDLVDPAQWGSPTALIEPGTGAYSDIFGVMHIQGSPAAPDGYYFGWTSDTETQPAYMAYTFNATSPAFSLPEVGTGYYDATMYLAPGWRDAGYHLQFYSDVDAVPDGGITAGLLGFGLVALGWLRRKT
jgi:hypothetical protein